MRGTWNLEPKAADTAGGAIRGKDGAEGSMGDPAFGGPETLVLNQRKLILSWLHLATCRTPQRPKW